MMNLISLMMMMTLMSLMMMMTLMSLMMAMTLMSWMVTVTPASLTPGRPSYSWELHQLDCLAEPARYSPAFRLVSGARQHLTLATSCPR